MTAAKNLNLRAGLLSVLIFLTLLGIWYIATAPSGAAGAGTAGMTAELITYRPRSAIRDIGKALGLSLDQVDRLSGVLDRLLVFSGQVVIGLLVIALGTVLANFAHRRLQRDGQPTVAAGIVRVAILGFVLALGLRAMGIGQDIVNLAFGLTLGSVAVAFALAFGLGGREAAGQHMAHWLARWRGEK